jgi:hypothetical protein
MGARSSPEGYRVAVGRYGLPVRTRAPRVRRLPIVGLLLVPVVAGGCNVVNGSKASPPGRPAACPIVAKLDEITDNVARADVHDPGAFKKTLDSAVRDYVTNLRQLRTVVPVDLHDSLERVEADVQQFRFEAALTDRAALDAFAERTCGRVVKTVTTSSGPAASTASTRPGG